MKKWIALLLALAMTLSLAACGGKGGKDRGEDIKPKPGPDEVTEEFCKAMKAFDFQAMNVHLEKKADMKDSLDGDAAEFAEKYVSVLRGWAGEMTWTAEEPVTEGQESTVKVTFRYTDASPVFQQVLTEFFSKMVSFILSGKTQDEMKEELGKILEEVLQQVQTGTAEQTVEFKLTETADGWKIREMPVQAVNVLFSNLLNQFNNLDIG